MWQWLQNDVYTEEFQCDSWPIFSAYTAEPETSAIGSVWYIFYNLLDECFKHDEKVIEEQLLRESDSNPSIKSAEASMTYSAETSESKQLRFSKWSDECFGRTDEAISPHDSSSSVLVPLQTPVPGSANDTWLDIPISVTPRSPVPSLFVKNTGDKGSAACGGSCDSVADQVVDHCAQIQPQEKTAASNADTAADAVPTSATSTSESIQPSQEFWEARRRHLPSLSEFYAAVAKHYYNLDSFMTMINFDMTEADRQAQGFSRFGVLGIACGAKARREIFSELTLGDFF